jgi:phosphatidate cytidylyltransferase
MDCQFIMGFFAYVYYQSFIAMHEVKLGSVLDSAINGLTPEDQLELIRRMGHYLSNQGIVSEKVCCSTPCFPLPRSVY